VIIAAFSLAALLAKAAPVPIRIRTTGIMKFFILKKLIDAYSLGFRLPLY
jgi:hypothetical protein